MMVGQACMKTSLVEGRGSGAVEERDKTMNRVGYYWLCPQRGLCVEWSFVCSCFLKLIFKQIVDPARLGEANTGLSSL